MHYGGREKEYVPLKMYVDNVDDLCMILHRPLFGHLQTSMAMDQTQLAGP